MMDSLDLCDEVLVTLRRIMRAIDIHSRRLEQRYGLTGPQMLLMKEIVRAGELSVGELARRANLGQATVTNIVDRLEGRGLVTRTRSSADKRRVLLRASTEGARRLRSSPHLLQEQFVARFRNAPDWEQTLMLSTLQRIAGMMDAADIDAAPVLSGEALVEEAAGELRSRGTRGEGRTRRIRREALTGNLTEGR